MAKISGIQKGDKTITNFPQMTVSQTQHVSDSHRKQLFLTKRKRKKKKLKSNTKQ